VASAAIVDYLSNEVSQEDIEIHSPFVLAMDNHMQDEWDDCSFPDWNLWSGVISDDGNFMAGYTGRFWVGFENMANNDIPATMRITVTCDEGIDGSEVDSLLIDVKNIDSCSPPSNDGTYDWNALLPMEIVGAGYGTTTWNTITYEIPMGDVPSFTGYVIQADITLDPYATGTYDVAFQIV
jgi:hypothetical protein